MWPFDGIYDNWKTSEVFVTGTLPANSRVHFSVDTSSLQFNEVDAPAIFARLQAIVDARLPGVLFTHYPTALLVQPVRRQNAIRRLYFTLQNRNGAPVVLGDLANINQPNGQALPPGLMIMLGGEPAAPLFNVGETHIAQPALVPQAGGFDVRDRLNTGLPVAVQDITPVTFTQTDADARYSELGHTHDRIQGNGAALIVAADGVSYNNANTAGQLVTFAHRLANRDIFTGRALYDAALHDFLASADKRFTVTVAGQDNFAPESLFNGDYEDATLIVNPGETATLSIDFVAKGEYAASQGIIYAEGYFYVASYSLYFPAAITGRAKDINGNWFDMTPGVAYETPGGRLYRLSNTLSNFMTVAEFTITAFPSTSAWISTVEFQQARPLRGDLPAVLDRFSAQRIYQPWQWRDGDNVRQAEIRPNGTIIGTNAILRSPNGHYWRQTIDDAGAVAWQDLGTNI